MSESGGKRDVVKDLPRLWFCWRFFPWRPWRPWRSSSSLDCPKEVGAEGLNVGRASGLSLDVECSMFNVGCSVFVRLAFELKIASLRDFSSGVPLEA
jgi:hypothetical protein